MNQTCVSTVVFMVALTVFKKWYILKDNVLYKLFCLGTVSLLYICFMFFYH